MARFVPGDRLPDFAVATQFENETTIRKIAGGRPLMLVVLRYIGCSSCRYDIHMIQENHAKFAEKGVRISVVMQSAPESVRKALVDAPLDFPIICDPDLKIYEALEIRPAESLKEMLGEGEAMQKFMKKRDKIRELGFVHGEYEGIEEQLPAFFYTDADLKIIASHYAKSIGDMPTAEEMLAM